MVNINRNQTGSLPIDIELMFIVRQRQLEVSKDRNKLVTLTEIANEIVREGLKGLEVMEMK